MEWLGYRVHDPNTRGFLSRDPLVPVVGAAWVGNPYAYAGNDPLHAVDPQGLRPVTDAELQQYTHRHHTGSFWERNGTAVAGVAITAVGVVVTFAPIPGAQIIGGALVGGGVNMTMQGLQNPGQPPDMVQVGINAAFGAVGGGIGSYLAGAAKAGNAFAQSTQGFCGQVGLGFVTGAFGGSVEGAYTGWRDGLTGAAYWENLGNSAFLGGSLAELPPVECMAFLRR